MPAILSAFAFLLFGILENIAVVLMITRIGKHLGQKMPHSYLYVFALAVIDLLFLGFQAGFLVNNLLNRELFFGVSFIRTAVFAADKLHKILSTFLIVLIGFDRYLGVCKANSRTCRLLRTKCSALFFILIAVVFAFVATLPIFFLAETVPRHFPNNKLSDENLFHKSINALGFSIYDPHQFVFCRACVNVSRACDNISSAYSICLFLAFFIVPSISFAVFYGRVLHRISHMTLGQRRRGKNKQKFTFPLIIACLVVYYICWVPIWLSDLIFVISSPTFCLHTQTPLGNMAKMLISLLPYFHSAINPILYAFLNKTMMSAARRPESKQFRSTPTNSIPIHSKSRMESRLQKANDRSEQLSCSLKNESKNLSPSFRNNGRRRNSFMTCA
jgi:hypothetical protein